MMPKVSIYIPCYNAERYLARTIEGALRQTRPPDEILIIYGESRDSTLQVAARYPVRVIRQEGRGLAAARNTAFQNARHELVAALDADCIPEPDWLEKLAAVFDDPRVALAGGKLTEGFVTSAADRWRQAHMPQDWGPTRLLNPRFVFGSNVIARKKVVEEVSGYREEFRAGGEDSDISRRIRAQGYRSVYEPAARVTHIRQDTVRSVMATFYRWYWCGTDGMRLRSVLGRALFVHFGINVSALLKEDWRRKNYSLLWLDVLTLFYMPYLDFRSCLKATDAPERQVVCAEARPQ